MIAVNSTQDESLTKANGRNRKGRIDQQRRASAERLRKPHAEQAADVLIFSAIPFDERRLFALEHRRVRTNRRLFRLEHLTDVDGEIEARPRQFHPTPGEKETV